MTVQCLCRIIWKNQNRERKYKTYEIMSPEEIFKTMQKLIAEQFALNPDEITMDSSFEEDLGADSVDLVELVMAMEEEFELDEIPEEELTSLKTVGDCVRYLSTKLG